MKYDISIVLGAGILAMIYAYWKSSWIESQDEGNSKMKAIGASIAEGAMSFLKAEYRVLVIFVFLISRRFRKMISKFVLKCLEIF